MYEQIKKKTNETEKQKKLNKKMASNKPTGNNVKENQK